MSDFNALNNLLKARDDGLPHIVIDLDRLDHNLAILLQYLPAERLRLVCKSLPCLPLLNYLATAGNIDKLMAFHLPFVSEYLDALPGSHLMMGKPLLAASVADFCRQHPALVDRVEWLVDTPDSLAAHIAIARRNGITLNINLELDVGLHRGGIRNREDCDTLLKALCEAKPEVNVSGVMAYEAHIPYYPDPDAAFVSAMNRLDALSRQLQDGLGHTLATINSGGSTTIAWHARDSTATDIAVGSAFLAPAAVKTLPRLQPACHISAPVLKRMANPNPRAPAATGIHLYTYGGGWAANTVWPPGTQISPHADPPNQNLLPNQCLFETTVENPTRVGDHLFFHPMQGDALFQFEDIVVVRGEREVDCWHPVSRRF